MGKTVDYYFSPISPWTYLGHARFAEVAKRYGAVVNVKPAFFGTMHDDEQLRIEQSASLRMSRKNDKN